MGLVVRIETRVLRAFAAMPVWGTSNAYQWVVRRREAVSPSRHILAQLGVAVAASAIVFHCCWWRDNLSGVPCDPPWSSTGREGDHRQLGGPEGKAVPGQYVRANDDVIVTWASRDHV